ncbi:MAG: TetR/AcrR family transcriptional regulator [Henriciella sp.]
MTKSKHTAPSARERILKTAKSRFATAGFDGTSTRQIAEDADVAQSLLLYHFKSKDAIWRAVMDMLFGFADQIADDDIALSELSIEDQLMFGIRAFVDLCAEDPDLHRLMTLEGRTQSDRLTWLIENHLRRYFEPTRSLIMQGQQTGLVRQGDPTMLYYSIIAIAGTIFSFEPEMTLLDPGNKAQDREQVLNLIRSMLFNDR